MRNQWEAVPLSEVLTLNNDVVDVNPLEEYPIAGVYSFGKGLLARQPILGTETTYKVFHRLHKDNFVLSQLKAWEGALARVTKFFDGWFLSPQFQTFSAIPYLLDISYLEWYFKQSKIWEDLKDKSQGMGARRDSISPKRFLSLTIPLPPLDEQRCIVARIEELAAKIEEARGLRREVVEEASAIHNSAFIQLFNALSDAKTIVIEDVANVHGGIQKSPNRKPDGNPVRYLTVAHVHRNHISVDDPRFFEVDETELEQYRLEAGDVLVIEGNGSADQIGRAALFRGEIDPCVHQNHVIRVRPKRDKIDPEFLNIYFNSPICRQEIQTQSRSTSGLRTLSVGRIKRISIIVPPLDEQRRIVAHLDALQERVDALKREQAASSAELDALLPSILDKAFKGEL